MPTRSLTAAGIILLCGATTLQAQTLTTDFVNAGYTLLDLGSVPGLPAPNGGLTIKPAEPNTLYICGAANGAGGVVHTIGITRNVQGHITGYSGTSTLFATAGNNDGGLFFAPNGTMLYTRYPLNELGQLLTNSTTMITNLTPLGVNSSVGSVMLVPTGFVGAGKLVFASYNSGTVHQLPYTIGVNGEYILGSSANQVNIISTASGPEGIAYVPPGSPAFTAESIIISSYGNGKVVVYEADANGLPMPSTARDMVTGLSGAEGALIDPVTGDLLFSTFGGANTVIRVSGFADPEDCLGIPFGPNLPGTPCDDSDACTTNDTWSPTCDCIGTFQDADGDGTCDANDLCPGGPEPGTACDDLDACTTGDVIGANCLCAGTFADADGDGTADCNDGCPADPNKIAPGQCGCGVADTDGDGDGTADCNDGCPADPNKTTPGICGCGVSDADTDGDGTADCNDGCPADPNKIAPGQCGCGVADTDTDGDGTADCVDPCPALANIEPGDPCDDGIANTINDQYTINCVCAGTPVACTVPGDCNDNDPCTTDDCLANACVFTPLPDGDGDGTCDAQDGCPADPNKTAPGICGCGVADTDTDGDGTADCVDPCPALANIEPGDPCDDGIANTINDQYTINCVCAGTPVACTVPGDCNDGDPCTTDDCVANACVFTPLPDGDGDGTCDAQDGCPADPNKTAPGICGCGVSDADSDSDGTADCNDGCPADPNKIAPGQCGCGVADTDTDGDGTADCVDPCPALANIEPGDPCDDGIAGTINDQYNANCLCVGTPVGCTEILTLELTLDDFGSETTVELRDETGAIILDSSGPYADGIGGTVMSEQFCVNPGCYRLYVYDAGGDGIAGGGYVLRDASNRRIIDADGLFGATSTQHVGTPDFCVPLSNQGLIPYSCDRTDLLPSTTLYCNGQPGATGFQWWWHDPHGSYSRRILVPTNQMKANQMVTNPVPYGLELNIRVRALIGGNYTAFGKACTAVVNDPGGGAMDDAGISYQSIEMDDASTILTIHPNPNRDGVVNLMLEGLDDVERVMLIDVFDLYGKRVHAEQVTIAGGTVNHVMDLSSDLSMGMYVVNVSINGQHFTQRLLKQ